MSAPVIAYNSVSGTAYYERQLKEWQAAGFAVTSVSAMSQTHYRRAQGRLGRLLMRARMHLVYPLHAAWTALHAPGHRATHVVTTNPFFAPALVALLARRGARVVQVLYDLYPDALIQGGRVSAGSAIARGCAATTRIALRRCWATVFLGDRLRRHAETSYGPARRAFVIPVGADGSPFAASPPMYRPPGEPIEILYCGQLGHMHESATVSTFLAAARSPADVVWRFRASGPQLAKVKSQAGSTARLDWGASLDAEAWIREMKQAQVALVTMAPGSERVVMPSKTYSALVAGQAVLAICPRDSDLADLINAHRCGWTIEPGDVAGLERAVQEIELNRDELHERRRRAFAAGHHDYDIARLTPRWVEAFGGGEGAGLDFRTAGNRAARTELSF